MGFLEDHLRPEVDYSSLYDGSPNDDPPIPADPLWKRLLFCSFFAIVGVLLLAGAIYLGFKVDWNLFELTGGTGRRALHVWTWIPMVFMTIGAFVVGGFGVRTGVIHIRTERRERRDRKAC